MTKIETEFGHALCYPLRLLHRKHIWVNSFKITLTSFNGGAILPFWWIVEYPSFRPHGPPDDIQFT
jgi:hypothetical protein